MSIDSILEASRIGMQNERLRLDLASKSVALANQPIDPRNLQADGSGFASTLMAGGMTSEELKAIGTRTVLDPGHPLADAEGRVHYPAVDMVQEMTTLMTASRGYEANVRSFNVLRGMVMRALEIGAK
jgi:flagellar basal-body rod protein FlgC